MSRRAALFAFLLLAPPALAAVSRTALTGRVTSGAEVVAGVTVTATSPALQHARTTVTGAKGTYWLAALPPGEYEVTFEKKGLQSLTRRVTVALARIARADAKLEPSEDEESVTSTVTTISVGHDTAITNDRSSKSIERLPVEVNVYTALYLAPGETIAAPLAHVDEVLVRLQPDLVQGETVDALALFRGATPMEYAQAGESMIVARTRSGGEELSVSLRDTITEGAEHFLESAAGGRIVEQRLWFFGAGWGGRRADSILHDASGLEIKLTGQLDDKQNLEAIYIDGERDDNAFSGRWGSNLLTLRHTAQWNAHLLTEITASHTSAELEQFSLVPLSLDQSTLSAKASAVIPSKSGDHVVTGGVDVERGDFGDAQTLFLSDRWWVHRLVINAGLRYGNGDLIVGYNPGRPFSQRDESSLGGQIAAAYDLRGNGRHAVTGSASRYVVAPFDKIDEVTFGYVAALGATGSARADFIRRDYGGIFTVRTAVIDASYRLFDRLEAGVNYAWSDADHDVLVSPLLSKHVSNAWISVEIPVDTHALTATVVHRYTTTPFQFVPLEPTNAFDVGLRYSFPVRRVAITLATDAQNLFDSGNDSIYQPRIIRGWVRVRL